MLRTRDFALFAVLAGFLISGIGLTWVSGIPQEASPAATALVALEEGRVPDDAIVDGHSNNQSEIIARLQNKVSGGLGDIHAGEPNFDSVDTLRVATDTEVVTDQTYSESVLVGQTMDGMPLMSDDSWRFLGWKANQQIGIAVDGFPIYGTREDSVVLDECGGIDEGSGYRYYMKVGKDFKTGCVN